MLIHRPVLLPNKLDLIQPTHRVNHPDAIPYLDAWAIFQMNGWSDLNMGVVRNDPQVIYYLFKLINYKLAVKAWKNKAKHVDMETGHSKV